MKNLNGSLMDTVKCVSELRRGSMIEINYDGYKDTFKLQLKNYPFTGTVMAWVNTTNNGYMNDFAPNLSTLKSALKNRTITVL